MKEIKIQKKKLSKKALKNVPEEPGVYIFWQKEKPLYIGKSKNLRKRLKTYFSSNLSQKTEQMFSKSSHFSTIRVNSELEALLLEAKLVGNYQPKYNSQLKDDKHPLYIKITEEEYPRVLTARKKKRKDKGIFYGPFPSSGNVKSVLKMLRKIFPFAQHKPGKRACLYNQMGLCNPCPSEIAKVKNEKIRKEKKQKYKKNIRMLRRVLEGKLTSVKEKLIKEMEAHSKNQKFQKAKKKRDKLKRLEYITQPITPASYFVENPNLVEDIRKKELSSLRKIIDKYKKVPKKITRIECFDAAHTQGAYPTASMVTFINAEPDKTLYRHFKIKQSKGQDDIASLKEVAERREKHLADWGVPDLILVDGGKTQVKVFFNQFEKHEIPVVGLAKRFETLVMPVKNSGNFKYKTINMKKGPARNLLQRLRDEAHRFARRYHHKLLKKRLENSFGANN